MNRYVRLALTAWIAVVVFIFPIPHTIALRNLLLVLGLLLVLATLRRGPRPRLPDTLTPSAWSLAVLTGWIMFQAVTVAPEWTVALDNMRGDWLVPLLIATLAAWGSIHLQQSMALRAGVAALSLHMLWVVGWQIWIWTNTGVWSLGAVPFGGYDYQSVLGNFLVALLLADRLDHLLRGHSPLGITPRRAWLLVGFAVVCILLIRARNGTIIALGLLGVLLAVLMSNPHTRRHATSIGLVAVLTLSLVGLGSWHSDQRWRGLTESTVIGWTSSSRYWLTNDLLTAPSTPSGTHLETSAYLRSAWARQAVDAIADRPLGYGFGRDAFGRAVELRYGHKGMVSSHSGWLDFALGTGLPGIALLLLTAGLAIRGGWQQFRQHNDGVGLLFSFFVGGYLFRILLDGHFSGWRLGLFAFICGVLIASMKSTRVAK